MTGTTEPRSVLLVDSDDDTRELYAQAFESAGWTAAAAESGPIALAKAIERVPTVMVTELRLVGIDGFELIRILRHDADTRRMQVIVVSADVTPASMERATQAGANRFLAKPCLPDALVAEATALATSRAPAAAAPLDALRPGAARAEHRTSSCPVCGTTLSYTYAHVTQVGRRSEQWLHFTCPRGCGRFEYRERTRKFRRIS